MAIKLEDKPNVVAPNADYPYGAIKDNTGANDGTPVNKLVYDDFHQFFARMMAESAIAYNDLPDNATNGFQYFLALQNVINSSLLIKKKIIEIGDWNMDSDSIVSVAHDISSFSKIRSVEAYIRNDNNEDIYPINTTYSTSNPQGTVNRITPNLVYLFRVTGGLFDSAQFNSTSFNRGWIHITYVD